jgi:hypothetical protein
MNMTNFKSDLSAALYAMCRRIQKMLHPAVGMSYTVHHRSSENDVLKYSQIIFIM